jgi:gamma-glutamyl-gamma-aminobutyrate hydrolase PuuD
MNCEDIIIASCLLGWIPILALCKGIAWIVGAVKGEKEPEKETKKKGGRKDDG